jgi:hypothetical protein
MGSCGKGNQIRKAKGTHNNFTDPNFLNIIITAGMDTTIQIKL